jgi:hypothetical protein
MGCPLIGACYQHEALVKESFGLSRFERGGGLGRQGQSHRPDAKELTEEVQVREAKEALSRLADRRTKP